MSMLPVTHIGKMLTPSKVQPRHWANEGVYAAHHIDREGRNCGPCWAINWQGKRLQIVFGSECEAEAHLILLRGEQIPHRLAKQVLDRRERMAAFGWGK